MKENVVYVQGVEKAIQEKYGKEAVQDPRANWDEEKEKSYLEQLATHRSLQRARRKEKVEADGFLVSRKLLNRKDTRTCPICSKYSFEVRDDVYIKKFECCYECFVQHVEGREEHWKNKKEKLLNVNS